MRTLHLKPAPGCQIRYPDDPTRLLPAEGAAVPACSYWQRRLAEGSAVKVTPKGGK